MSPRTGPPVITEAAAEKDAVDAVVAELVAGGADLRCVSLNEMKRRVAAALRTRRPKTLPAARLTSAV